MGLPFLANIHKCVCRSSRGIEPKIADVHCSIYGTEVFEVNEALRDIAVGFAKKAKLNDSALAVAYRAKYASLSAYAAATAAPSVVACDVVTSDVYYSGTLLSEAAENVTKLYTNGSAVYCTVSAHSPFQPPRARLTDI
jgi:purine nucleoside permease